MFLILLILLSAWLVPAIACFIIIRLIAKTDFNWHALDSASMPYKALRIVNIMTWIPCANIIFSKELYDLYKEIRDNAHVERPEEFRRK